VTQDAATPLRVPALLRMRPSTLFEPDGRYSLTACAAETRGMLVFEGDDRPIDEVIGAIPGEKASGDLLRMCIRAKTAANTWAYNWVWIIGPEK
jgi:hypothetical protein